MADAVRAADPRHPLLLDAPDRARRHPGRHQPDRLDRRGRLRGLPARPVARRRAVGPDHGGRPAARHPPDRAVRGAPHRGRHLQLRLGHDDRRTTRSRSWASSGSSSRRTPTTSARRRSRRSAPAASTRKLVGIEVDGDALPFELSRKCVGAPRRRARSGPSPTSIWSPRLEKNIGYVWVPIGLAGPGTPLEIEAPDGGRWRGADGGDPVPRPEEGRPARPDVSARRRPRLASGARCCRGTPRAARRRARRSQ